MQMLTIDSVLSMTAFKPYWIFKSDLLFCYKLYASRGNTTKILHEMMELELSWYYFVMLHEFFFRFKLLACENKTQPAI